MVEATPKRHLAAILAADVVGYSRLMGLDEAGTLERLKVLRRDLVQPLIAPSVEAAITNRLIEFHDALVEQSQMAQAPSAGAWGAGADAERSRVADSA